MSINKIKQVLVKNAIIDDKWQDEAKYRHKNEAWLDLSLSIAVRILRTIREKKMTQKELSVLLKCSPQYLNKIVKGNENLTLETICKLEEALNITLIDVPAFEVIQKITFTSVPQLHSYNKSSLPTLKAKNNYRELSEQNIYEKEPELAA